MNDGSAKGKERHKTKCVLTYSSLGAVFTVPDVAEDGIGQLPTESHIKIP